VRGNMRGSVCVHHSSWWWFYWLGWVQAVAGLSGQAGIIACSSNEKRCVKNALTVCIAKTKEEMQFEHYCIHGLYFSRGADSSLLASLQQ